MQRDKAIERIRVSNKNYDFIIIGGGATGIGIALEAATRGYKTILLEKSDFTKSTSSKSTKLVHGGVRYLAQGDVALVREACIERGRLLRNAPHLVKKQPFVIPTFNWFDELLYTVGLTFYDLLAGKYSLGRSIRISKKKAISNLPTIQIDKITAGVLYHDGQFDDSRLGINAIQSAVENGAIAINYMPVRRILKGSDGVINGVEATDTETGEEFKLYGKAVINSTGVFADDILQMDNSSKQKTIRPSQGIHLVFDKSFLPGNCALMIPKTDDGRVLFAVPWYGKLIVGTTDTPIDTPNLEPIALEDEIEFILNTMSKYLIKNPSRNDVLSIFAGLRPLAAAKKEEKKTKEISRSHKIYVSESHLFTIIGGKWTTFRRMAQDLVDKVEKTKRWTKTTSITKDFRIHGYKTEVEETNPFCFYGTDSDYICQLMKDEQGMDQLLSNRISLYAAQVAWAVREEMARTVEDVLSRRVRCLLLDAREAMLIAPKVAEIMAKELSKNESWQKQQVDDFVNIASKYLLR